MKANRNRRAPLALCLALGLSCGAVYAAEPPAPAVAGATKPSLGAIVGVVRSPAKAPVAGAVITAQKADGSGIRAALSGSDGVFSFADLPAGSWTLTAKADGLGRTDPAAVEVTAGDALQFNVVLGVPAMISSAAPPAGTAQVAAGAAPAPTNAAANQPANGLWQRGERVALRDIKGAFGVNDRQPVQLASLTTPPSAFDKPNSAVPIPAPMPQSASPGSIAPMVGPAAAKAPSIPDALQAPDASTGTDLETPFAYGDFTWLNGTPRNHDTVLDTKFFTPEIRFDTHFMEDFNQPMDHTIVGATESFRSGEIQIEQASVGGDFHWQNVRGRILFMQGLFASTTPRNDASSATGSAGGNTGGVGQWDLQSAYKYVSEAWGGYHFNVQHGLNVDAGIFVSYIGLFSYYNYDNWTYQPSYVSSNTPWFFNGLRVQYFPTNKLKIEPWVINGWQSYAKFNGHVGLGGQLLWQPTEWFKLVANQYGYGEDNLGLPHTQRIHTDDSIEVRYYNNPNAGSGVSKMAFSLTGDAGCQYGGGITCHSGANKSDFLGWMLYDRTWFNHDTLAVTVGGGQMTNPGRYLTLLPPIDGAFAASGTPYFTENPGQTAHMWDGTVTLQYMPKQYITWWTEVGYRHSDIPYFAGRGGVTPPGGNNGLPQYYTCMTGASAMTNVLSSAQAACSGMGSSVWYPDLRRSETKLSIGVMVKF